jgi:hypothetical protein
MATATFAQDLPAAKPETVDLSSERLGRIGMVVQRNIDGKRIAGAVTKVARHGQVAWLKAQGAMDREAGADASRCLVPHLQAASTAAKARR